MHATDADAETMADNVDPVQTAVWSGSTLFAQTCMFENLGSLPAPVAQLVECLLWGTGRHGFDPVPRHTKGVKNGTSCSLLGTQTYRVELGLVDPVSG